jgi:hypothetical protein
MPQYLFFHPDDHPAYLKKVGNWVITFASQQPSAAHTQLMLRYVIPQQMDNTLQLRSICIEQSKQENYWEIQLLQCYDAQLNTEMLLAVQEQRAQEMLHTLIQEFQKYDVDVQLKKEIAEN